MNKTTYSTDSPKGTLKIARSFAKKLNAGDVIALYGELGKIFTKEQATMFEPVKDKVVAGKFMKKKRIVKKDETMKEEGLKENKDMKKDMKTEKKLEKKDEKKMEKKDEKKVEKKEEKKK